MANLLLDTARHKEHAEDGLIGTCRDGPPAITSGLTDTPYSPRRGRMAATIADTTAARYAPHRGSAPNAYSQNRHMSASAGRTNWKRRVF
jgi:hypothetical protein